MFLLFTFRQYSEHSECAPSAARSSREPCAADVRVVRVTSRVLFWLLVPSWISRSSSSVDSASAFNSLFTQFTGFTVRCSVLQCAPWRVLTLIRLENACGSMVRVDSVMDSGGGRWRVRERRRANAQENSRGGGGHRYDCRQKFSFMPRVTASSPSNFSNCRRLASPPSPPQHRYQRHDNTFHVMVFVSVKR